MSGEAVCIIASCGLSGAAVRSALAVTGEEGTSLSCVGLSDAAPAFCQSSSQTPSLSVRDFGESSGRLAVITVNGVPKRGTEGTVARGIMELVEKHSGPDSHVIVATDARIDSSPVVLSESDECSTSGSSQLKITDHVAAALVHLSRCTGHRTTAVCGRGYKPPSTVPVKELDLSDEDAAELWAAVGRLVPGHVPEARREDIASVRPVHRWFMEGEQDAEHLFYA